MVGDKEPRSRAANAFDVGELFTGAVRRVAPAARERNLSCLFDVRGPTAVVRFDADAMQRAMHRLLHAMTDLVDVGTIEFAAETRVYGRAKVVLSMKAVGHGSLVGQEHIGATLQRLRLEADGARGVRLHRARGTCVATAAPIEFSSHPSWGGMFSIDWTLPVERMDDADLQPDAAHAQAWIIHDDKPEAELLRHRLERLGWSVSVFDMPAAAVRRLRAMAPGVSPPAAVLAIECGSVSPTSVQPLVALLASRTQRIYAVPAGSPALRLPAVHGFDVRLQPFSPGDLRAMTACLTAGRDAPAAAWPQPVPGPGLMLVVDDDPVARVMHGTIGQTLGYEVRTAGDGIEAIEQCRRWRPDIVLIDVEMPGLDGLAAARRLRELEMEELIPRSRIVAVTGMAIESIIAASSIDGFLPKPLSLETLCSEISRLEAPGRPAWP